MHMLAIVLALLAHAGASRAFSAVPFSDDDAQPPAANRRGEGIADVMVSRARFQAMFGSPKVGDFVVYEVGKLEAKSDKSKLGKVRREIEQAGQDFVIVHEVQELAGANSENRWKVTRNDNVTGAGVPTVAKVSKPRKESVAVGSRKVECELVEHTERGKIVLRRWTSAEVPFEGIVKEIQADGAGQRLVDFGRGK